MILLSLILVHFIGDFYFQTNKMVLQKAKYLTQHVFTHFLLSFFVLVLLYMTTGVLTSFFIQVAGSALFIAFFHYLIDKGKIYLTVKLPEGQNLWPLALFLCDQLLHIGAILLTGFLFFPSAFDPLVTMDFSWTERMLILAILFILVTTVSGHIIRLLLGVLPNHLSLYEGKYIIKNSYPVQQPPDKLFSEEFTYMVAKKQDLSRGLYIGYVERLLVIVLIVHNAYSSIAFIIAAKSLARFKQMDDRDFAEYFLLGTLSSIFLGIIYGIIVRLILFQPV
ncbi:DUF3307 domain-containing protein [Bacillaceae bacterium Marseille-Q3522]|nr:DUF3307 domain-containing protein [Bacillaceae bacterium Marseille-Q3522]